MEALRPGDPERVGRYRLLKRLGTGGMGRVYLGQSPSGRQVAVKIIRAELADNADFRRRFRQEVRAARRVGGIFTAPVVDADPDAPEPWMVTAFVSGPSLAEAVASRGPMPVGAVLILAAGLAEGLSAVHAAGLVHRDLKPSNVLLASDGPRIIDFGISRSAESVGPTQAGSVFGSPGFMSPEQALGEPVGPASDIFSLGSVLAYAATGEPPFGDGPPSALLYRVVHGEAAIGNVPRELVPLVARCLLSDPAARPTTDDLLGQLGQAAPVQGWLDLQGTGEETPGWPDPHTMPSEGWDADAALAGAAADEMQAVPSAQDARPDPADVVLAGASLLPRELPDFAAPEASQAAGPPAAGGAGGAAPGPSPAGSISRLFLDRSDAPPPAAVPPFGRDRRFRRAGVLAAGGLGIVIVAALATWLLPRLDPNPPAAAATHGTAGPSAHRRASGHATPTASPPAPDSSGGASAAPGLGPSGLPLSPSQAAEADVVRAYFAAINSRSLEAAWVLGGDNLYASPAALEAAYADVSHLDVAIVGVRGDNVLARISGTSLSGTLLLLERGFTVRDGAIVASTPVPG
ncbi:MAG TPA: serine/threonine-protein kinase [Streptosporangiaceae bacterium]|nr:serine/threonine-protein kinase [Streptosporangiaceae bacterium]